MMGFTYRQVILDLPSINWPPAPQRRGISMTHKPRGPAKAMREPSWEATIRSTSKLKGTEGTNVYK